MSYIDRLCSKISKYRPDDRTEVLSFRRRIWPGNPSRLDELYWKWQFQDNPSNPTPQIWVLKDDGRILGHQAAIPIPLKVGNAYYRGSWAIDLVVDPRLRSKGAGHLLSKRMHESTDVSLALGISDDAYSMYKRDGWIDMGYVPRFAKVLNAKPLIEKRLRLPVVSEILSSPIDFYLKFRDIQLARKANRGQIQIDRIDHFDGDFDALWERVSGNYPLIARRDSKYLNWKYISQPGTKYTIFRAKHGDKTSGYIVLRMGCEDKRRVGYIVDFLAAPEQLNPLIAKAVHYFKKEKTSTIVCYILNRRIEVLMEHFGFHRRESGTRFMIKASNPRLESEGLRKRDDWFVTCGDSDMERSWDEG